MKKLLLPFAVLIALTATAVRLAPGTLTPDERKFAIDYYLKTKERLLADVKGLSAAQLNWKADSSRWSVYQCTEHIALSETLIFQWLQMTEHQAANPEKRSEAITMSSDQLIARMTDRSHKFQAPEMLRPAAQFASEDAAIRAFVLRRDSTIEYIKTTQDDLKDHFVQHPLGIMDLYQLLVMLAAHSARHTAQLEEVMATPGFPKN
jgi:hypothetical protein